MLVQDNTLTAAVDEIMFGGPTNGTQAETPAERPAVLYSLSEFAPSVATAPPPADLATAVDGVSAALYSMEDPAVLAERMDNDFPQEQMPAAAMTGGSRQLANAVDALAEAQNPMTMGELNGYLSRGGYNSNADPYGNQLRSTIRAIMRRQA